MKAIVFLIVVLALYSAFASKTHHPGKNGKGGRHHQHQIGKEHGNTNGKPPVPEQHQPGYTQPSETGTGSGTGSVILVQTNTHQAAKFHNHVSVTFNGKENDGWLVPCGDTNMVDSPSGCAGYPHKINARNDTAPQMCSRKCSLTLDSLTSLYSLPSPIHIQAFETDEKHSAHAKCKLSWSHGTYLVGYDLKVHYVWIENVKTPFIQVTSCEATPIVSDTPLQIGQSFTSTRVLVLDGKMDFILGVVSFVLVLVGIVLTCCLLTCCVTCLCLKCFGKSSTASKRCCRKNSQQRCLLKKGKTACNANVVEMQSFEQSAGVLPQQPYAYFVLAPYSAPQEDNQSFVLASAPQEYHV